MMTTSGQMATDLYHQRNRLASFQSSSLPGVFRIPTHPSTREAIKLVCCHDAAPFRFAGHGEAGIRSSQSRARNEVANRYSQIC